MHRGATCVLLLAVCHSVVGAEVATPATSPLGTHELIVLPEGENEGYPVAVGDGNAAFCISFSATDELTIAHVQGNALVWSGALKIPQVLLPEEWFVDSQRFLAAFAEEGELILGFWGEGYSRQGIVLYRYDQHRHQLTIDRSFPVIEGGRLFGTKKAGENLSFAGLVRHDHDYVVLCRVSRDYFHPGVFISGDMPSGRQLISLTYHEDVVGEYHRIPEPRVDVQDVACALCDNGTAYALWVQQPPSYLPVFREHRTKLCCAAIQSGKRWSAPFELIQETSEAGVPSIQRLALSSCGSSLVASWDIGRSGRYFGLLRDDRWNGPWHVQQILEQVAGADAARAATSCEAFLCRGERLCIGTVVHGTLNVFVQDGGSDAWSHAFTLGVDEVPVIDWKPVMDAGGTCYFAFRQQLSDESRLSLVQLPLWPSEN